MLAYLFWHVAARGIEPREYETALLDFLNDLARAPPAGFASCATYRIAEVPWLDDQAGYEDWYFVDSSGALDALNEAAVAPQRWDVHAAIASRMGAGHGGLYRHLFGDPQPRDGTRAVWLTRPRGIRFEPPLREAIDGTKGFLSCWRRQMVLGPADEFVVVGTSDLDISMPQGWQTRTVDRSILAANGAANT